MPINVSIITVCLNSINTMRRTVDAVVNQLDEFDEYIIVDGGSIDGTLEYILGLNDIRVKIIRDSRGGVYSAINDGLTRSTNDVVGIIHSDDYYVEGALKLVKDRFQDESVEIAFGSIWKESPYDVGNYYIIDVSVPKSVASVKINHVHPAVFVKREIYSSLWFDTKFKITADLDFFIRCYKDGVRFGKINHPLAVMSSGGLSDTRRIKSIVEGGSIRFNHGDYLGALLNGGLQLIRTIKKYLMNFVINR